MNGVAASIRLVFEDPIFTASQTYHLHTTGLEGGDHIVGNGFHNPRERGYEFLFSSILKTIKFETTSSNIGSTIPTKEFKNELAKSLHFVFNLRKRCANGTEGPRHKSII